MNKTPAEKAAAIVAARQLDQRPVTVRGRSLTILRGPELIDGNVHVWVSLLVNGIEQVDDPHFVFVNPPILVLRDNLPVEVPEETFPVILGEAVSKFLTKRGR